jgi:hypothetical protein
MPIRELTLQETENIEKIMAVFVKSILARKEMREGRYTGEELTNQIYQNYLKSLSEEDQRIFFENILLYLSTFKKHEFINLLKGTQKLSSPWLVADYKNALLPDFLIRLTRAILKLNKFKDKDELAEFIKTQAISSLALFLENTPDYVASNSSTNASSEESFDSDDFEDDNIKKQEELAKYNKIAMRNYQDIIVNLIRYCHFIRLKLDQDKTGHSKENIHNIEQIQKNCEQALTIFDAQLLFNPDNIPIDITQLIKYTNFIIQLELETDTRIMQQQNIMPKFKAPRPKEIKPVSYANKIVASLSKLLEALLKIKEMFKILISVKNKKSDNTIHRDEEADSNKKQLMLFYESMEPAILQADLQDVRNTVAKLQELPKIPR